MEILEFAAGRRSIPSRSKVIPTVLAGPRNQPFATASAYVLRPLRFVERHSVGRVKLQQRMPLLTLRLAAKQDCGRSRAQVPTIVSNACRSPAFRADRSSTMEISPA